jgi:hypothetical protein
MTSRDFLDDEDEEIEEDVDLESASEASLADHEEVKQTKDPQIIVQNFSAV